MTMWKITQYLYKGSNIKINYDFNSYNHQQHPLQSNAWIGIIPANITSRDENVNDQHDIFSQCA